MRKTILLFLLYVLPCPFWGQQALLSIENDWCDFGKIKESEGSVSTTFTFSNTGTSPLVLTNVKSSCGCTVIRYIQEPVEPNEKGWIIVAYNTTGRPGKFSKTIVVTSNAANAPKQNLRISGEVVVDNGLTLKRKEKVSIQNIFSKNHTVQQGEDITSLANKYHVSTYELAKINHLSTSSILKVGQIIQLPNHSYLISEDEGDFGTSVISTSDSSSEHKQSLVDQNLPQNVLKNNMNTYVLIFSNEDYLFLDKVKFANNDGNIFKEYCLKILGVPEKQIFYYRNASYGLISDGISKLTYCLNNFEGAKGIVYYCGHGIPDEKTGQAFLIPVDGKGTNMTTCYSLNTLYKTLANTKAQSITYFMDACFTGANKEGSMLVAARGVARAPEKEVLTGKTVVFSASSGDETAMTLNEEGHGLFTYYLLKKLQETDNVSYGELADYINQNVKKDAFLINEKPQTPVVATSPAVVNTWRNMKLK